MKYCDAPEEIKTKQEYLNGYSLTIKERKKKSTMIPKNYDTDKISLALEKALDIRKFEIDLYWKRATYFWAFIALAFTSYFLVLANTTISETEKNELCFLLSGLGLFLAFCWFLVNKGSKYWQENWEKHVDLLEDEILGPLYKTTVKYQHSKFGFINPLKAAKYSVGKINQFLSFSILLVWIYLFCNRFCIILNFYEIVNNFNVYMILGSVVVLIACLLISTKSSQNNGENFTMERRKFEE